MLAPSYVETEFAQVANSEGAAMLEGGGATAESVAACGYDAIMAEKLVVVNTWKLSLLLQWIVPLLSRRWVFELDESLSEKKQAQEERRGAMDQNYRVEVIANNILELNAQNVYIYMGSYKSIERTRILLSGISF